MKTKLKIIIASFLATTAFWFLTIVAIFWLQTQRWGIDSEVNARQRGLVAVFKAWNREPQPVTFTVEELSANKPSATEAQVVLLERQLPPSSEFRVGIRKMAGK